MTTATEVARVREEFEEDRLSDNVFTVMMFMVIIIALVPLLTAISSGTLRVQSLRGGYEPTAGNSGLVWLQVTASGYPNELRMVAENSTGAFEQMLLGLTT